MSASGTGESGSIQEAKLPWRDWILLPVMSLLTIVLLAVSTELIVRRLFPVSQVGFDHCFEKDDPTGDGRVRPNTVCSERIAESKFQAEYRFNSCGHRAGMECGPKQPGVYRIVMIGSSLAFGLFVPREMTFAGLLPDELSRQTGRKIEFYNEATGGKFRGGPFPASDSTSKFNAVLSEAPDMILWIITSVDIENTSLEDPLSSRRVAVQNVQAPNNRFDPPTSLWSKLIFAVTKGTLEDKLRGHWEQTRTSLVLKHFLLSTESQDQYVRSYLKNEKDAGFLKSEPTAQWQYFLERFEMDAAEFERQARSAGVPFVAVLVPNRAQAAMISMGEWPNGYDPYKVDDELHSIIVRHDGMYVSILPEYRKIPDPERHYFPVDGHPNADGQAMIAAMLAKALTSGAVPELRVAAQPQTGSVQGK